MRISDKIYGLSTAILLHAFVVPTLANELDSVATAVENWQYNRLFSPSPTYRSAESRGAIVIYDGLTDIMVKQALDQHFDRIQNMMFTRTIITNENGEPARHPETGKVLLEDDGC
jgi:hypothetical protein